MATVQCQNPGIWQSVVCTQGCRNPCVCMWDICIHLSSHNTDGCPSNHIPKGSLSLIFWSLWLRPRALVSPSSQYYMHIVLCKYLSTQESTAPAWCFQSHLAHSEVNSRAIKTTEEKVLSFTKGWGGTGAIRLASHHVSWKDKIQHPPHHKGLQMQYCTYTHSNSSELFP